jgi:hypothetical protein
MTIEEIERLIVSYFETKTVEEVEGEWKRQIITV